MGDSLVAEGGAVLHDRFRPRPVVVGDAVQRRGVRGAPHQHHRHLGAGAHHEATLDQGAGQDQAVRPQLQQRPDRFVLLGRVPVPGVHEDAVAGPGRLVLDPGRHVREEGVVEVGDHHPDHPRAPLDEAAGHGVGPVTHLGRGLQDRRSARGAHVPAAPHDEGHEGLRDPGPVGDVGDGGLAGR